MNEYSKLIAEFMKSIDRMSVVDALNFVDGVSERMRIAIINFSTTTTPWRELEYYNQEGGKTK